MSFLALDIFYIIRASWQKKKISKLIIYLLSTVFHLIAPHHSAHLLLPIKCNLFYFLVPAMTVFTKVVYSKYLDFNQSIYSYLHCLKSKTLLFSSDSCTFPNHLSGNAPLFGIILFSKLILRMYTRY